jgi:hypothetical protein
MKKFLNEHCQHLTMRIAIIALVFVAYSTVNAQRSGRETDLTMPAAFSKSGSEYWASGGAGVASFGTVNSPLVNPAALHYDNTSIYVEGAKRFGTKYLGDFDYDGQIILPQYASVGFTTNNLNVAFSYVRSYDLSLSFSIPITTTQYPEGTGELAEYVRNVRIHSLYGSVGKTVGEHLSLGIAAGLQYMTYEEKLLQVGATGNRFGLHLIAGTIVRATEQVNFGATLSYGPALNSSAQYSGPSLNDSVYPGGYYRLSESYTFRLQFPWTINMGVACNISPTVDILLSAEYQHWSHISDTWRNLFQIHFGAGFTLSQAISIQAGFFTQDAPENFGGDFLGEQFLTAGIRWTTEDRWMFSANVLDSHLLSNSSYRPFLATSGENFRQASVSLGVGYTLPAE